MNYFDKSNFLKKRELLSITGIVFLMLVVFAVILNMQKSQDIRRRAGTPPQDAILTMSTAADTSQLQTGETFTVNIGVDSLNQNFYAADIVLQYDSSLLQAGAVKVGSSVNDTCPLTNPNNNTSPTPKLVLLAPITSKSDCRINLNGTTPGNLKFSVVAFDWNASKNNSLYVPTPLSAAPAGTYSSLAQIEFTVIGSGSNPQAIKLIKTNVSCPSSPYCNTTDSNIAALSSTNNAGDILASVNPEALSVTTGTSCQLFNNGDANCDNICDILDISLASADIRAGQCGANSSNINTDVNADGVCDILDFSFIASKIRQGSCTP